MKRFLKMLLLLVAFTGTEKEAKAQTHLAIEALVNFPDTAVFGQTIFPTIVVRNVGNTPYIGTLQVYLMEDSIQTIQALYTSSFPDTINPQDTVTLMQGGANGFTISPTGFRMGNNVVVVWPYSTSSSAIVDTLHTNIFIRNPVGLPDNPGIKGLEAYPNPAGDFIQLSAPQYQLESVRIMDLSGRLIQEVPIALNDKARISLDALSAGVYLLQITTAEKATSVIKFIRLKE